MKRHKIVISSFHDRWTKRHSNLLSALISMLFVLPFAHAQEDQGDVFELSPFEVDASEDMGYVATSALTGSRLRTNLSDVAASVSVFTEEFLNDTGMTDLQELATYSVGTVNATQDENSSADINNFLSAAEANRRVRLRGIRATKGIEYFQAWHVDDGYNTGRYDESRGPNGILFGISEAGGIINKSLLKANTRKDSARFRYTTGTYNRNRAELRFNKVLIQDILAVTAAGVYQRNEGWRDYDADDRDRIYGTIKWTPTEKLTIQIMGEQGEHFKTSVRPFSASDRFLPWYLAREKFGVDAVTFDPRTGTASSPTSDMRAIGIDDVGAPTTTSTQGRGRLPSESYVYNVNDGNVYSRNGLWQTDGQNDGRIASIEDIMAAQTIDDIYAAGGSGISGWNYPPRIDAAQYGELYGFQYPTHLNAGGPDMWRNEDFKNITFMLDYQITDDLYVNFAHHDQTNLVNTQFDSSTRPEIRGDPNTLLYHPWIADFYGLDPDTPNPNAGRLYFDSEWRNGLHTVEYKETRASISYNLDFNDFDLGWMGRHRLAAGYAQREVFDHLVDRYYGFLGNPFDYSSDSDFDDARNRIVVRSYLDEGDFSTYRAYGPPAGDTLVTPAGEFPVGFVNTDSGTSNVGSVIDVKSTIFAVQNYFWNDRIVTTFGWREDEANNISYGTTLDPLYGLSVVFDDTGDNYREDEPFSAITKTAGVVFHLTDNLSLIANFAQSINLPYFRNIVLRPEADGTFSEGIADPLEGEGYDLGIGFNLFDGRLSGRLIYFDTEAINRNAGGGAERVIGTAMRDAMRALDDLRNAVPAAVVKADGNPYSDSEWEVELDELNGGIGGGRSPQRINSWLFDEFSDGYELSVTANMSENWRFSMNASYTNRTNSNYGRSFAQAAGFKPLEGTVTYINPIEGEAGQAITSVDVSQYVQGGLHERIMQIALRAQVTPEQAAAAGIREIPLGQGPFLIDDDLGTSSIDVDQTVGYELWDSADELVERTSIRSGRWGLTPWKANFFTSYDFRDGMLDGFRIGGGFRYLDGTIVSSTLDGTEFKGPSQHYFDLMVRYQQKLKNGHRIEYQVNVYNVLGQDSTLPVRFVDLDDPTTPLSRNLLREPASVRCSITYSF